MSRFELLVFTEGELTEVDYIQHWHRKNRFAVNVEIDSFHGAPRQLVQRAAEAKKRNERGARRGRGRAHDEVWCVFDTDQHPGLREAEDQAHANGINLAISNPCIELWFLLHFQDQAAHLDRRAAQSRSNHLLRCEKALSRDALATLEDQYATARQRAIALDAKHRGDGSADFSNPSTSIWRLIDSIDRRL